MSNERQSENPCHDWISLVPQHRVRALCSQLIQVANSMRRRGWGDREGPALGTVLVGGTFTVLAAVWLDAALGLGTRVASCSG